jgi:hypothetical protein
MDYKSRAWELFLKFIEPLRVSKKEAEILFRLLDSKSGKTQRWLLRRLVARGVVRPFAEILASRGVIDKRGKTKEEIEKINRLLQGLLQIPSKKLNALFNALVQLYGDYSEYMRSRPTKIFYLIAMGKPISPAYLRMDIENLKRKLSELKELGVPTNALTLNTSTETLKKRLGELKTEGKPPTMLNLFPRNSKKNSKNSKSS